jgi:hypothetical protein
MAFLKNDQCHVAFKKKKKRIISITNFFISTIFMGFYSYTWTNKIVARGNINDF